MSARKDVMGHDLCPYASLQGKCGSQDSLWAGTVVSVDPTAARLCDDSENGVPVKLVSLALKGGFLKSVHSCWNRGKTQNLLNGLFCDGDLLLPDINRLQGRHVEVGVELNYPREIDLPWLFP